MINIIDYRYVFIYGSWILRGFCLHKNTSTKSRSLILAQFRFGGATQIHLLKLTAKAPENRPSQKEIIIPTIIFHGQAVKLPGSLKKIPNPVDGSGIPNNHPVSGANC